MKRLAAGLFDVVTCGYGLKELEIVFPKTSRYVHELIFDF